MKFIIKHEIPGRIRVHMVQPKMTFEEADICLLYTSGIPGIMASKTIENDNDRRLTIMTSTFVPCGAKLPVIALMAGVIGSEATGFPAGSLTFIMYAVSYTHLLKSGHNICKKKGQIMKKNMAGLILVLFAIAPVSYTHLDVYKRQTISRVGWESPGL